MPSTLKTNLSASIKIVQSASPDGGSARVEQTVEKIVELLSGTTNDKADLAFVDTRTLTSGSAEDIDLAGALANALGETLTMAEVVAILIVASASNTTNLTIGGSANGGEAQLFFGAAGDKAVVKPGGLLMAYAPAGWAITAGSGDDLGVANGSGASATYDLIAIGRSA